MFFFLPSFFCPFPRCLLLNASLCRVLIMWNDQFRRCVAVIDSCIATGTGFYICYFLTSFSLKWALFGLLGKINGDGWLECEC